MVATAQKNIPELLTVGAIAERFGEQVHRVQYVAKTWRLQPAMRAGITRLYGPDDVDFIGQQLRRLKSDRERRGLA